MRGGADQDRIGTGEGLQAGGEVGRLADDRLLARRTLADRLTDHDNPGRDADAHGQAGPVAAGELGVERRQRVEDREAGANRALGILLLRDLTPSRLANFQHPHPGSQVRTKAAPQLDDDSLLIDDDRFDELANELCSLPL